MLNKSTTTAKAHQQCIMQHLNLLPVCTMYCVLCISAIAYRYMISVVAVVISAFIPTFQIW